MNFKDCLQADVATFINLDEFAETVDINGEFVSAVISRNSAPSLTEYTKKKQINPAFHRQLEGRFITLYVKAADLKKPPKNGDFVTIDAQRYSVRSCSGDCNVLKLECAADTDRPSLPKLGRFFEN